MNYFYKLNCKIRLPEDVSYKNANYFLSAFVNRCMLNNKDLSNLHTKKHIKGYSISNLFPYSGQLYHKGKQYFFNINFVNYKLALDFKSAIAQDTSISSVSIEPIRIKSPITKIHSVSPCISSKEAKVYWRATQDNVDDLKTLIDKNIKHKAKFFEILPEDEIKNIDTFIDKLTITNNKDIVLHYKKGTLFGYSIDIVPKSDPVSQELAKVCLALGIGERNSLGFGYCLPKENNT